MLRKTLDNLPLAQPYLIVCALSVLLFFPTWSRLFQLWLEFEQVLAHGLATALIFLALLLVHPPQAPNIASTRMLALRLAGGLALISVTLVWALLELVRIDTLAFLMLPAGVLSLSWALLGLQLTRSFLPHVLILALSLPFWADLVAPLVVIASEVVGTFVRWLGITALIEGNSITLASGRLLIADGCSGIRYFAISILLAMMTATLNDYRWKGWLITLLSAMLIGLVANWVRIIILVIVAYETEMQSSLMSDHETMGWLVFAAFIGPALYFAPVRRRTQHSDETTTRVKITRTGIAATIIAFLIGPGALMFANSSSELPPPWTPEMSGFREEPAETNLPLPLSLPDVLARKTWKSDNIRVSLAQSQKKTSDGKIVPYIPVAFDRSTWQVAQDLGGGMKVYLNIVTRERVLMAQWYHVGSKRSNSYREAKLLQIPAMLTGESRFALVTLQAPCTHSECKQFIARFEAIRASISDQM